MVDETGTTDDYGLDAYDPGDVIARALDEMDAHEQASFNVYEQLEGNSSKMPFLFTVAADQYTIEQLLSKIAHEYGGGNYRIHLRGSTTQGKNLLIANQVFPVKEPKRPPENEAKANDTSTDKLLEYMRERDRKTDEQMSELRREVTEARTSRGSENADPFNAMERAMQVMAQMHNMIPQGNGSPAGKQKSLIEQLHEAKEISKYFSESTGEQSEFVSLIREGLGPLIEMAKSQNSHNQSQNTTGNQNMNGAPQSQSQPKPTSTEQEMQQTIGGHVQFLLQAAARNGDPEVYADMVLDFTPEQHYAQLREFLMQPNALEVITAKVPAIAQHLEWFKSLKTAILASLDAGDDDGETSTHVPEQRDHRSDATGHGDPDGPPSGEDGDTPDIADDEPYSEGEQDTATSA